MKSFRSSITRIKSGAAFKEKILKCSKSFIKLTKPIKYFKYTKKTCLNDVSRWVTNDFLTLDMMFVHRDLKVPDRMCSTLFHLENCVNKVIPIWPLSHNILRAGFNNLWNLPMTEGNDFFLLFKAILMFFHSTSYFRGESWVYQKLLKIAKDSTRSHTGFSR